MSAIEMMKYITTSKYCHRIPSKDRREDWFEAVSRVEQMHIRKYPHIEYTIKRAFDLVRAKRVLGSQRAMQFGGEPIENKNTRMYNCGGSYCDRIRFFQEYFWIALCGTGPGYSNQKHHVAMLPEFAPQCAAKHFKEYVIPDTIEGWADSLGVLIASYLPHPEFPEYLNQEVQFNYTKIRAKGSPLSSGIGKAPGPEPLRVALENIRKLLNRASQSGPRLRTIDCYDITMFASDAVLAGGVRRSATLCAFSHDDQDMLTAKTGNWQEENPQRSRSNNSALLLRNSVSWEEFQAIIEHTKEFGEPGYIWVDDLESIYNPCVEINFYAKNKAGESGWHFCNLCEINGQAVTTKEQFYEVCWAASVIGTLQAGYTNFEYLGNVTKEIVEEEALLGVSITGIMDSPEILLDPEVQRRGAEIVLTTNELIAGLIGIKPTARATCDKPAGTSSIVLGATASGVHFHHARLYVRRVQDSDNNPCLAHFRKTNPDAVEKSVWGKDLDVISFCITSPPGARVRTDYTAIDQLEAVKLTQQNWVQSGTVVERCAKPWLRHNVSNTISVGANEWDVVARFIYENRHSFAGVSLLSAYGDKDYPQPALCEIITPEEFYAKYFVMHHALYHVIDEMKKSCGSVFNYFEKNPDGANKFVEYMYKDADNLRHWQLLQDTYKPVDYSTMREDEGSNVNIEADTACAGGECELPLGWIK